MGGLRGDGVTAELYFEGLSSEQQADPITPIEDQILIIHPD